MIFRFGSWCFSVEFKDKNIDLDLKKSSEGTEGSFGTTLGQTLCDCLPSCVTISYDADVAMVDVNMKKFWATRNRAYKGPE